MAGFGNYLKQAMGDHAFGVAAMTVPAGLYLALMSVEPADDGTGGTEITGTGYARASCGVGATSWVWDAALHGVKNVADILFPLAGANDWIQAIAGAVYDASVAGNLWGHAALLAPVLPSLGDQVRIPAGSLVIRFNP